ncbi:MAG: hypothetical protein ABIT83_26555 [Massilia sp.]
MSTMSMDFLRMVPRGRHLLSLLLATAMVAGQAQEPPAPAGAPAHRAALAAPGADPGNDADAAIMVVRVTGLRAVPWKSYSAMRAALAAFEAHKALAPDAIFSFAVLPPEGKKLPPNFNLRVRTKDGEEFPITLENGELFQLPVLPDPDVKADLVSNLKGGQLRIGLLVHTRSVSPDKERLGDIRLRCEINEAIAKVDQARPPSWKRASASFCTRSGATVWHRPRAPATGAWLVTNGRREALPADGNRNRPSYEIRICCGGRGNDAIIEFDYNPPLGHLKFSEVAVYDAKD